ncbi:MAG: sigma-70 family RNA polymerase sigma factor [Niabella sp.]
MSEHSINEWVNQSLAGDQRAFKEIVGFYQQKIFSYVFRIVCDEEEAKDIAQETFIRAWTFLPKYDFRYKFSTWLYKIATNCSRNYMKKAKTRTISEEDLWVMAEQLKSADLEQRIINENLARIIVQLTHNLAPKQKLVFTLKCLEGLDTDDITGITNLNATQIKNNLYLAKKYIREQLQKHIV